LTGCQTGLADLGLTGPYHPVSVHLIVGGMLVTQSEATLLSDGPAHVPAALAGSYPVRPGNLVRPLVDGVPAFQRIGAAIDAAHHNIWLTVAFYSSDFTFPGSSGTLFDVLDRAVERGLDVRIIFWRPNPESSDYGRTFPGSEADRDLLRARGSRFSVRWDRTHAAYCQHQKSWVIDAGQPFETTFVGGINLTGAALGSPGHRDGGRHDLYVEVSGPSATDAHHNFVQRWNEASERNEIDGVWGPYGMSRLPFPTHASGPRGASLVQIQRMVPSGRYADGHAVPGGRQHDIAAGERSILEQYEQAIEGARSSIYIENQALPVPAIAHRLESALRSRLDPDRSELFDRIEALGRYETFTLAGLAVPDIEGRRAVYVHAKCMLVDDAWATIGSCNLHANSLGGHTEMNASVWDGEVVRALRCKLLAEHLGQDTDGLDDRAALRLYRRVAERNSVCMTMRKPEWRGLAFTLSPAKYGR